MRLLVFSFLFVAFLLSEVSAQEEIGKTRVTNVSHVSNVSQTQLASDTTTSPRAPFDHEVSWTRVDSSIPTSGNVSTSTGKPTLRINATTGKPTPRINGTTGKPTLRINATTPKAIDTTTDDYDDYSSTSNITNTTTDDTEPPLEKMATSTKIALGVSIPLIIVLVICLVISCSGWKYYKKGGSIPYIRKRVEKTKGYEKVEVFDDQRKSQSDRASAIEG